MRPRDKTVSWFTYPEIYMFVFYDSANYQTCPSHICQNSKYGKV